MAAKALCGIAVAGRSADAEDDIFVAVANGTFDAPLDSSGFPRGGDYGNAFVKLTLENGALAATDYWTMDNSISESNGDIDLGSGGIMLLPEMEDSNGTVRHLAVGAGKDQSLWVVNRDNMGKYDSQANATIYQAFANALPGGIFSNPAYFNGRVYFGPYNFHFHKSHMGYKGTFDAFFESFIRGEVGYGPWFRHVSEWDKHAGDSNLLFLRYEELAADVSPWLPRIAEFCGRTIPEQKYEIVRERSNPPAPPGISALRRLPHAKVIEA
jgi:hypothetical protein